MPPKVAECGLFRARNIPANPQAYASGVNPRGDGMKLYAEIHIHHHNTDAESLELLRRIDKRTITIMTDLTRLTSEVSEIGTAVDSAVALLGQLAQLIRDNATDPAALNSLADSLDSQGNELAAAVVANTPQDPAPTP